VSNTSAETEDERPFDDAGVWAAVAMGAIFVGTILLSILMAETLTSAGVDAAFEDPQDPTNPLIYLGLVLAFTALVLLVAKLDLQWIIQAFVLGAVFLTMAYLYWPILGLIPGLAGLPSLILSVGGAGVLTALLFFYPEWYIVDAAGISVAAGATGLFGFSFGIVPALVLLVAFAVYDAIAVYRTEHMLDLADQVMDLRLPVMLVIPKVADYSFVEAQQAQQDQAENDDGDEEHGETEEDDAEAAQGDIEEASTEGGGDPAEAEHGEDAEIEAERDALFMGLGDIVIPGVLVVSSYVFLAPTGAYTPALSSVLGLAPHLFVAMSTLVGATAGFVVLMRGVLKGSPHAGLPALNGGALIGFIVPLLWIYGTSPLVPQF